MSAHPLLLLDTSSPLADDLKSLSNALFQVPVIITALVLTFVCAILAWIIAFLFLRPKENCSLVCVIHYLLTIATIVLGMLGAMGLIDHLTPGDLITGAGLALLVLTIPLFILVESFNYVVLSNKHARRHRDLRTAQDRRIRRGVVFLAPLVIGAILLVVGLIIRSSGVNLSALTQVIILLLILWVLALGTELLVLLAANRRRRRMAAVAAGPSLDREEVAAIWVQGFSSYRIGRGETVFTDTTVAVEERETSWGVFTERVYITEELLLEEEGELDLIDVEEAETVTTYASTGAGVAALPMHDNHRNQRHPAQNRFWRRWGWITVLLIVAIIATAFTIAVGTVGAWTTAGIALAFLAPVIFLVVSRFRRDSEVHFATETAQKVGTSPARGFTPPGGGVTAPTAFAAPAAPPAAPRTRGASGALPAVAPLHPARPVPVNPPIAEPQIPPKEEPDAPTLPSVESAEAAGAAHENPDIADDTIIAGAAGLAAGAALAGAAGAKKTDDTTTTTDTTATDTTVTDTTTTTAATTPDTAKTDPGTATGSAAGAASTTDAGTARTGNSGIGDALLAGAAGAAVGAILAGAGHKHKEQEADTADDALLIGHTATSEVSDKISITEFQHYLRGIHYPATRAQLIAQARANNAPPNMIARLEVLDETYTFTSVSEVMRGYAYHRYLRGVTYPATRDQLIAHARANNAPPRLILWLEGLETTVVFVSLVEVLRRRTTYLQEKGEDDTEELVAVEAPPEAAAPAVTPAPTPVSNRIGIIEFQRYLHGVDYPVTRAQLIAQARANNAPPNMIARLEELDENHSFVSVRDVMIGYAYHRYLSGVTYPATRDQLLAHARANKAPSKLIIWIESLSVTVVFVSLTEVVRSYASHQREEVEEELEEEVIESPPPPPPAPPAPAVSSRIGIIEFQRYLHGVDYPATRAQLIAQAQANNATPNMIARLQELDDTHSFVNVRDVMIGYAYHRYLSGVTYPATRDQLLAHARTNKAPAKLIGWLETLEETVTFANLTEVVRSYATYRVEEEEDEDEEADEPTITIAPSAETAEAAKGIGFREFSHFLRGIHYPATRDQLIAQARTNNAPAAMITRLEELPAHHEFKGMADVMRGYGHHITDDDAGK